MDLRILDMKLRELVDDVDLPIAIQLLQYRIKDLAPPPKRQRRAADVSTILARGTGKGGVIRVKARDAVKLERAISEAYERGGRVSPDPSKPGPSAI